MSNRLSVTATPKLHCPHHQQQWRLSQGLTKEHCHAEHARQKISASFKNDM
jgi:hypothetical protein